MLKQCIFKLFILLFTFQIQLLADKGDFEKVTLQLQWLHQFQFAGYYVAKEKNFYKNVGLKVNIKEFGHGINPVDVVISNKATYGTGRSSLIIDKSNGKPIHLLAAIFQSSPLVLMASPKSGIKTIKDLKGKSIMLTPDESTTVSINAMLSSQGVSINDMTQLKHTFDVENLINGTTDISTAYLSAQPYKLIKAGIKPIIFDPKDYGFDFYNDALFTSSYEVTNHPNRVKRFKEASLKGWKYAFDNIEETVDLILKKYNTQNKTKDELIFEANKLKELAYYKVDEIGKIDKKKVEKVYDIYNVMGHIKNQVNFDEFVFDDKRGDLSLTYSEENYIKKNKIIRMCNNSILSPIEFAYNGNQNDMRGISIDVLKLIEKQLDIKFVNVFTKDWGEAQQFLKEKKCDILSVSIVTPQRARYANFTKPYLQMKSAIFTQKDSANFVSFDDVANKSMSQIKNSGVSAQLLAKYPNLQIIETNSAQEALEYVNDGKAFFTTGFAEVGIDILTKYALDNVHIAGYTKKIYDITIAVRDDDILLLNVLNKALKNITKKQHKQIYKKWVTPIVKEKVIDYHLFWEMIVAFVFIIIIGLFFYLKQLKLKNSIENQKELFEAMFKGSKDAIAILDMESNFLEVNTAYEEMTGFTKKELLGTSCLNLTLDKYVEPSQKAMQQVKTVGYIQNFEKDCMVKNDKFITVNMSMSLIHNPNRVLISVRDITELKKKDKLIAEQLKMAALGEMIGNIAHQWRQPLSVISTCASGLQLQKEYDMLTDEFFNETCETIENNTQILSKTIDDFRDYVNSDSRVVKFNLKNDSDSFLKLVDTTIKDYNINVILELQEHIDIEGYPNHLMQCFISIFNNAKDALIQNNNEDDRYIFITQKIIDKHIFITFKDNAGGISEEILPKIFEPYFTTKHQSQGTGLGLHLTYNLIVNKMNGTIDVSNEEYEFNGKQYKGAKFIIELLVV